MLNSVSLTSPTCVTNGSPQCVRYAELTVDAFTATHARVHAVLCHEQERSTEKAWQRRGVTFCFLLLRKPFQCPPTQFSLLSGEVLVKNIDTIVSPNNPPQIRLCLHAFGDNHSPRKCC